MPYWGLRQYAGEQREVWGGDAGCAHEWGRMERGRRSDLLPADETTSAGRIGTNDQQGHAPLDGGRFCACGAWYGALGLEPTPELYVDHMVSVFREVRRVLRKDGTLWLNLGDSYASGGHGGGGSFMDMRGPNGSKAWAHRSDKKGWRNPPPGLKPKDLVGIPWMVAFALRADGWYLRSDIIWAKPNPMPESVQGSHFTRHQVTIEEHEKLSRMRAPGERFDQDGAGDMPRMSASKVHVREGAVPAEREGAGDYKGPRGTRGRAGEAAPVGSSATGTTPEADADSIREGGSAADSHHALQPRRQGQGEEAPRLRPPTGRGSAGSPGNGRGLDGDSGATQEPMSLLHEAERPDDRPRHPVEQGREARKGEYRPGVPELQLDEEGQADPAGLVDCPGCPKCEQHGGYIFHLSAGRPTKSHEYLFLLTKSERYYYDADAIREPAAWERWGDQTVVKPQQGTASWIGNASKDALQERTSRNKRTVWTIATRPYPGAHFATYPEQLVEPCILAGSARQACGVCGAPWARQTERTAIRDVWDGGPRDGAKLAGRQEQGLTSKRTGLSASNSHNASTPQSPEVRTTGWQPTCAHRDGSGASVVLDPFAGSGTTLRVAIRHGRRAVGIDISNDYLHGQARIRVDKIQTEMGL